jgi:glutamate synthase domain-containing protein 3
MARLGFRTMDEMIGQVELLDFQPALDHWKTRGVDLQRLLAPPPPNGTRRCIRTQEHEVSKALDGELIALAAPALEHGTAVCHDLPIRNVNRTVGAMLSGEITRRYGAQGLPPDTLRFNFTGSAGQSFGAFVTRGVTLRVEGDTNDYLGKGLSGGKLIVVPPRAAHFVPHENIITGNVALYGATAGEVYIYGMAGERFAVRNSGAIAVVEGVGDHGCEYMTGGIVVVLGPTGVNFAAGMSGGIAYVYDDNELLGTRSNLDMVDLESVWTERDKRQLHLLIERHLQYTGSARARLLLETWETAHPLFVKVMPMDYKRALERIKQHEFSDDEAVSASEEVFSA